MAAIALQQRQAANAVQELVGVAIGERRDAEATSPSTSTWMPPRPNADERAEQRIVGDADHRLDAAGDHRLDEDAVDLVGGRELPRRRP